MAKTDEYVPTQLEMWTQKLIWSSRWLQAPIYLCLCFVLIAFIYHVFHETVLLFDTVINPHGDSIHLTLLALTICDTVLISNLILIVIISGYENFVSNIHMDPYHGKPLWIKELSHDGVKMKISSSLVAISAIQLLKQYLTLGETLTPGQGMNVQAFWQLEIFWNIIAHIVFVFSAFLLALMRKWETKGNDVL